jgi:hypothetical protein
MADGTTVTTTSTPTKTAVTTTTTTTTTTPSFYAVNSVSEWKQQLVTKEDPQHVHKTLGILVLLSYVWRLAHVGESDLGFRSHPQYTIPTLLLHLSLNASSFIFKIPAKRIASGYRIWPEYRLHSLVFLCRSLSMMLLFYCEQYVWWQQQQQQHDNATHNANLLPTEYHVGNILILLGTMAAADISTYLQGPQYQSGFARELDVPAAVKYFFSAAQIYATSMILTGHRRYTMQFLMVIIVQVNAFLMTIRRKNLASHALLTSIYGAMIFGAGVVAWWEFQYRAGWPTFRGMVLCANIALVLRTGPRVVPILRILQDNKYLLWLSMYALQEMYIRPTLHLELTLQRRLLNLGCVAAMLLLGVYKHSKEQRSQRQNKSV